MVGMPEADRTLIFRNMSARAVSFMKDDIRAKEKVHRPGDASVAAARELFAGLLAAIDTKVDAGQTAESPVPPPFDGGSEEGIIKSFTALADFCANNGLLAIESLAANTPDPLLKQGLTMLIDGADPLMLHNLMARFKESWLRAMALRMDLLIDGIDNLASGDHAMLMEMKLRSLVARP
jgi:hypothetical protein